MCLWRGEERESSEREVEVEKNGKERGSGWRNHYSRKERGQRHSFFALRFSFSLSLSSAGVFIPLSLLLVAEMGTGASRLVGGGAQGAFLAEKGGAASGDAAASAHDAPDDKARLPTPTKAALSEEDHASAAAAAAVACAFGLENFGNTCYCNSVLQVSL